MDKLPIIARAKPPPRINCCWRLPPDLVKEIKDRVAAYRADGQQVTETDVVATALREGLRGQGKQQVEALPVDSVVEEMRIPSEPLKIAWPSVLIQLDQETVQRVRETVHILLRSGPMHSRALFTAIESQHSGPPKGFTRVVLAMVDTGEAKKTPIPGQDDCMYELSR